MKIFIVHREKILYRSRLGQFKPVCQGVKNVSWKCFYVVLELEYTTSPGVKVSLDQRLLSFLLIGAESFDMVFDFFFQPNLMCTEQVKLLN